MGMEGCTPEERREEGDCGQRRKRFPGPAGAPLAWAESRQELCETLPYYRAFQSGCYSTSALTSSTRLRDKGDENVMQDSVPYGYLLAGFGASRDVWTQKGRVIISHGGGKSGPNDTGEEEGGTANRKGTSPGNVSCSYSARRPMADQTIKDGKVSSLLHSFRNQTPIVLLLASDYKLSHFTLPCPFAVLGWYWITDAWCERESGLGNEPGWIRWKFRFQYLQCQGPPWWLTDNGNTSTFWRPNGPACQPKNRQTSEVLTPVKVASSHWSSRTRVRRPVHQSSVTIPHHRNRGDSCQECHQTSPRVYSKHWLCLSPSCPAFWKVQDGEPPEQDLIQDGGFLDIVPEPAHFSHGGLPFSLAPPAADHLDSVDALRGLHCLCGRLSCRTFTHHWQCPHCGFIKRDERSDSAHSASLSADSSRLDDSITNVDAGITTKYTRWPADNLEAVSFTFPHSLGGGLVHVVQSLDGVEAKADEMFAALQRGPDWSENGAVGWTEETLQYRRHPLLCHIVKGGLLSQQFTCNYGHDYKHAVKMDTIALANAPKAALEAMRFIAGRTDRVIPSGSQFNEVYPVKYLETQKMNYHDDGEPGLGPVISSLSLGVEAKMSFRLKEKYTTDCTRRPASSNQAEGAATTGITMKNRVLLTIPLRHGCVAVQEGRRLQEMMEHAVEPQMGGEAGRGAVRIAVTARQIDVVTSRKRKKMVVQSVMKLPGGAGWAKN